MLGKIRDLNLVDIDSRMVATKIGGNMRDAK